MMDVSDGLAKDLHAITPAGTMPALDAKALPLRARATVRAALSDGEDYELLFALSATANASTFRRDWRKAFPTVRLSCIGEFVTTGMLPNGAVNLSAYRGYEHLKRHVDI